MDQVTYLPSSFRDPSGFVFRASGLLYRQINKVCSEDYQMLMDSGLYDKLTEKEWLIEHSGTKKQVLSDNGYLVIQPRQIPFISYPYEWCFSQLRDAAILTLNIQELALEHGMSLKDASAFNIQFPNDRPVFIDTLSFEKYPENRGWVAYKQFCQHFLSPLVLMSKVDPRLGTLSRNYIDGIPIDLAANMLPFTSKLNPSIFLHFHLHSKTQKKHENQEKTQSPGKVLKQGHVSKLGLRGLIDNLKQTILKLRCPTPNSEWGDYYNNTNYSDSSFRAKKELLQSFLEQVPHKKLALDLGANTGIFTRVVSQSFDYVVSADIDISAVEQNYLQLKTDDPKNILPLIVDFNNPSPQLGFANEERDSFFKRHFFDCAISLAFIHHIAISNNVPLSKFAKFMADITDHLIIEFVPKTDSKVQLLLASRKDIFPSYNVPGFESAFSEFFKVARKEPVAGSDRLLYHFVKR